MKEMILKYAEHNLWANRLLLSKLASVPETTLHKDMGNSFPSMFDTITHLYQTESVWWQRIRLAEPIVKPQPEEKVLSAISEPWLNISSDGVHWVKEAKEHQLDHVFGYYNFKKKYFKHPVYEVLMHLYNHQSYHRGQIITMLRQNGEKKLPATDLIKYLRAVRK